VRLGATFEPSSIVVAGGGPVRLTFHRDTPMSHGDAVVFPTLGRMATLPVGCDVGLDLPSLEPGVYPFTAADATSSGILVVRDP
jgi:plastocyanin domain-containing protein